MRGAPSHIKYEDGSTKELRYMGHLDQSCHPLSISNQYPSGEGIYHVGASGCGYMYFDGRNQWGMGYDGRPPYLEIWEMATAKEDVKWKCSHLATIRPTFTFLYSNPSSFLVDFKV